MPSRLILLTAVVVACSCAPAFAYGYDTRNCDKTTMTPVDSCVVAYVQDNYTRDDRPNPRAWSPADAARGKALVAKHPDVYRENVKNGFLSREELDRALDEAFDDQAEDANDGPPSSAQSTCSRRETIDALYDLFANAIMDGRTVYTIGMDKRRALELARQMITASDFVTTRDDGRSADCEAYVVVRSPLLGEKSDVFKYDVRTSDSGRVLVHSK